MPTARLSSKSQLVLPKAIRERLGVRPGDEVDFIVQETGDVLLRPAAEDIRRLKGILRPKVKKAVSLAAMDRAIRRRASGRK